MLLTQERVAGLRRDCRLGKRSVHIHHLAAPRTVCRPQRRAMVVSSSAMAASRSVAVIGAGAAGLASARELLREGHRVVVFEASPVIGGTWVYDSSTESDLTGVRTDRARVHSSMYKNLRTNLPREIMSYADLPFTPAAMALVAAGARAMEATHPAAAAAAAAASPGPCDSIDPRRYPSHEEVLRYLHAYATYYNLMPHVRLSTQVLTATPILPTHTTQQGTNPAQSSDSIRAHADVPSAVANGHHVEPSEAQLQGAVRPETESSGHGGSETHRERVRWRLEVSTANGGREDQAGGVHGAGAVSGSSANSHISAKNDSGRASNSGASQGHSGVHTVELADTMSSNDANGISGVNCHGAYDSGASQIGCGVHTLEFDALVVANGHYTEPSLPDIPGMDTCPVQQLHSHNYREPGPFRDKVVLLVGASNSGEDISRELSPVARTVYLSARTWKYGELSQDVLPYGEGRNIVRCDIPLELTRDGYAIFPPSHTSHNGNGASSHSPVQTPTTTAGAQDNATAAINTHTHTSSHTTDATRVKIDAVIYATGYKYAFPFLRTPQQTDKAPAQGSEVVVGCEGRYVSPLYEHIFPASDLSPSLSFIGLCWKVVPFPQCEIQARWVARALSGRASLPPTKDMQAAVAEHFDTLEKTGTHVRYAHMQNMAQFDYNDAIAARCDDPPLPNWREAMYRASGELKRGHPGHYRDASWDHLSSMLQEMQADVLQQEARIRQECTAGSSLAVKATA